VQDEAAETAFADEQVAASAQNEKGKITSASEEDGFEKLGFGGYFAEKTRRTANAEGGVGGERDILLYVEF
jgi:hypothetical protein